MRLAIAIALLTAGCGGSGGGSTTTPPSSPPPVASTGCTIPFETESLRERPAPEVKPQSPGDRKTRRGRVYEELWKHQAALARQGTSDRQRPTSISPAATAEDIGQIAVMRDEGDLVIPANQFDLQSKAFVFSRNGSGGYDVRP